MKREFTCLSLNVRGLRQETKRRELFRLFERKDPAVVLLQETFSTEEVVQIWTNEWGGSCIFNHGTANSKGVAILLAKDQIDKVESVHKDIEGRFLLAILHINERKVLFGSIYGPNGDDTIVFANLSRIADSLDDRFEEFLLGGDFNTPLDTLKDRKSNNSQIWFRKKQIFLNEFMEEKDLVDIWRAQHPEEFKFTRQSEQQGSHTFSRIDYFLISQGLANCAVNSSILPKYKTDHSMITVTFDFIDPS